MEQGDGTVRRGDDVAQEAMQKKEELQQRGQVRLLFCVSSVTHCLHAQEELQAQKDTAEAVGGADMPADQGDAQAKKNGFMNKIRSTRDS